MLIYFFVGVIYSFVVSVTMADLLDLQAKFLRADGWDDAPPQRRRSSVEAAAILARLHPNAAR